MEVISRVEGFQKIISTQKSNGKSIGFVPTMGALHEGHLSLISAAAKQNDIVVVSIFVNPTQFNNTDDLKNYPRTFEADRVLLGSHKVDYVFFPNEDEIYPEGVKSQEFDLGGLDLVMEGKYRPGHFQGMATIVSKLFDIVQPNLAYFGEKDFQQLAIIRHFNAKRKIPVKIIGCETKREEDGLAKSSRNLLLSKLHRAQAPKIFEGLKKYSKKEFPTPKLLIEAVAHFIEEGTDLKVEYIQICDEQTLKPLNSWADSQFIRIFASVYAGKIRLIDNISLF